MRVHTLLVAVVLWAPLLAPPTSAQRIDSATLVPARCIFHAELTPGPIRDRGELLALAKIAEEPAVRRFVDPLLKLLDAQMGEAEQGLREIAALSLDDLRALWDAKFTFTVLDSAGGDAGQPGSGDVFGIIMTVDFGASGTKLIEALSTFESTVASQLGAEFEDRKVAGRTVRVAEKGLEALQWVVHESMLVVTTTTPAMEDVLRTLAGQDTGPRLAASSDFVKARKRTVGDGTILSVYVDFPSLLKTLSLGWPDELRDVFLLWGINSYGGLSYGIDLDGEAVRDRIYVTVRDPDGWANAGYVGEKTMRTPSFVPGNASLYNAGMLDFGSMFEFFMGTLEDGYPTEARELKAVLTRISSQLGIDVGRDLVAALGPEYALYVSFPRRALIPDVGLVFEIGELARPKFAGMIENVRDALADDPVRMRSFAFRGHQIHYLDLSRTARDGAMQRSGPHTAHPSFAIVGDFLVFSLWPQSLKNLIVGLEKGTPRIKDRPDYAKLAARMKLTGKESSLVYVDLQAASRFMLDNAVPLAQTFVPMIEEIPVNMADLPPPQAITNHLFGLLGVGSWDAEAGGAFTEICSPLGAIPSYLTTVFGTAGALLPWMTVGVGVPMASAGMGGHTHTSREEQALSDLALLSSQVEAFEVWEGRLPKPAEWPTFLLQGSANHPDPYVQQRLLDPWGRLYRYEVQADGSFRISTLGADGKPGGEGPNADLRTGEGR